MSKRMRLDSVEEEESPSTTTSTTTSTTESFEGELYNLTKNYVFTSNITTLTYVLM